MSRNTFNFSQNMKLLLTLVLLTFPTHVLLRPDHKSNKEKWIERVLDFYEEQIRSNNDGDNNVKDIIMDEPKPDEDEDENEDEIFHKRSVKDDDKSGHLTNHSLLMPNVAPDKPDTYLCYALKVPKDDRYIVKFQPQANMKIAHHMLLYACNEPFKKKVAWNCREMQPVCANGPQTIMYAWGMNAPALDMPKDVGFHVGGDSDYKYLVLQVHYLNVTSFKDGKTKDNSGVVLTLDDKKKSKEAGIYLLANGYNPIPPHQEVFHVDNGCRYFDGPTFKPFRFRVHAHKLGSVITAYRVRDGKWTLIGRGDPQKPQAFYKSANVDIKPGDTLMGRCTYNSTLRDRWTYFGATHNDEMCNFYIMYSYKPRYDGQEGPMACQYPTPDFFKSYPTCSDVKYSKLKRHGCHKEPNFMVP